jgi:hypothetical protein
VLSFGACKRSKFCPLLGVGRVDSFAQSLTQLGLRQLSGFGLFAPSHLHFVMAIELESYFVSY